MRFDTIIFDVDGTLVDTFHNVLALEQAYGARYPERAADVPHSFFVRAFSGTKNETYTALGIPADEWDDFWHFTRTFLTEEQLRQPPFAGMADAIGALAKAGLRLGLNTSRTRDLLEGVIGFHPELFQFFDPALIITRDMVTNHKPAPDSLQYIHALGVSPESMLFIGDSNADKLCAKAANTPYAWAAWGLHVRPESLEERDLQFATLDQMIAYIGQHRPETA